MTRTIILNKSQVSLLERGATQIRLPVRAPDGPLMYDLTRAFADHGFPMDNDNNLLPMSQWNRKSPRHYRYHYLHVPFAHPDDGWEKNPDHDTRERVYCEIDGWEPRPGDRVRVKHPGQPRARLSFGVRAIRVERLCAISLPDCAATGAERTSSEEGWDSTETFIELWDRLYPGHSWENRPWAWVIDLI